MTIDAEFKSQLRNDQLFKKQQYFANLPLLISLFRNSNCAMICVNFYDDILRFVINICVKIKVTYYKYKVAYAK